MYAREASESVAVTSCPRGSSQSTFYMTIDIDVSLRPQARMENTP